MKTLFTKLILITLILIGIHHYCAAQVCGTTTLSTQAQINALSCTSINGDLIIDDNSTGSIVDLNPLFSITSISGNLTVTNNPSLSSLVGLDGLTTVGGNIKIQDNNQLFDFGAFGWQLTSVTGDFEIINNTKLSTINIYGVLTSIGGKLNIRQSSNIDQIAFQALNSVGSSIELVDNNWTSINFNSLTTVGGGILLLDNICSNETLSTFASLQTMGTGIDIRGNQGITDIDGFGSLTSVGSIFIVNNDFLGSIDGFNAVNSTNVISIDGNIELLTIDGFTSLTNINSDVKIINNGGITSIAGFGALTNISGDLEIINNLLFSAPPSFNGSNGAASTLALNGFNALQTVGIDFIIKDNNIITSITGFAALNTSSDFVIENNTNLGTINGFNSLSTTGINLMIRNNSTLTSIAGFAGLSSVGNTFRLDNNDQCNSITGFGALATVGDEFNINWNAILSQINGFDALTTVPGWFNITFNDGLTSVNGFAGLDNVARFRIHTNPMLTSVAGFQNVTAVAEGIDLYNNTQLSMCCWIEPVYVALSATASNNINNNAAGCNSIAEIGGAAPVINCPATQTFSNDAGACNASFSLDDPTVTDECNVASYTASLVDANGNPIFTDATAVPGSSFPYTLPVGTNVLSYTAADGFGNTSSCSVALVVVDNEVPTWTNTGSSLIIQAECGVDDPIALLNANVPTATDNCGVQGTSFLENIFAGACGGEDVYQRIYTAEDASGNFSADFTVEIEMLDTQGPTLQGMIPDVTINCNDIYPSLPAITAFDDCEGDLTTAILVTDVTVMGDCSTTTSAEVKTTTWDVVDACGNPSTYSWTVTVTNNFVIDLGADQVACNTTDYLISAPAGISYLWSTGETSQDITVTQNGNYEVTVTSFNGCCSIDNINITFSNGPDVMATGGTIDCSGTAVTLMGSSNTAGVSYLWSGPGGYSSSMQNPQTTQTGTYTVLVTDANGCTSTAEAEVVPDTDVPDLTATGGEISCTNTTAMLSASSTSGTSYAWSGPGSFSSAMQNPTVSTPGSYSVIVTAANGCTNITSVEVTDNTATPSVSLTSGMLSCTTTSTNITSMSTDNIITYTWSGPNGFSAATADVSVSSAGVYTLTITADNGCTSSSNITVTADDSLPTASVSATELNCNNSQATLTSTTDASSPSYSWSGPNGFTSSQANPTASDAGTYTLIVTAANGCTVTSSTEIILNDTPPVVSSTATSIDCNNTMANLSATSDDTQSSFAWSGPSGFTSTAEQVSTTEPGNYQVIVTASNGCTSITMTTVAIDTVSPSLDLTLGSVDCGDATISIAAAFDTDNSISWSGPSGFTSTAASIDVNQNGNYTATVINPDNGCSQERTIIIDQDLTTPTAIATGGELSCNITIVQLQGSSNNTAASYSWSGPGGYSSSLQNPSVDEPGSYILVVTSGNGCTATATTEVTTDASLPDASVTGEDLSCLVNTANLEGTTNTAGVTTSWEGPNGFMSTDNAISVSEAGVYIYTVQSSNGCSITASYEVLDNTDGPAVNLVEGDIDCNSESQELSLTISDDFDAISWSGPNGFSANTQLIDITDNGTYTAVVTGANGCETTRTVEINLVFDYSTQINTEDATGTDGGSAELILSGGQSPFTIEWDNGQTGFTATDLSAGDHTVIVTDGNGCMQTLTFMIDMTSSNDDVIDSEAIKVFPNPVMDYLQIEVDQLTVSELHVYTAQGQLVRKINIDGMTNYRLDMSSYAPGMYHLLLATESQLVKKTILKAQ